ncbi:MAG: type II secretion system major pseudopilin GspG [Verrucomicrobiae bacterium]|nr:type II secretion system major pseudopilin GspG [Verrucomicrobiae bacterium]
MHHQPSHRQYGYTLVEIMLVLSIIAVLLGAGIYYLAGNVDVAKITRVRGDIQTLTAQLNTYRLQNFKHPTTQQGLQALVSKPTLPPVPSVWVQLLKSEALIDPWGNPYQYLCPGKHNATSFDLWSWGPNGPNATEGIVGNWEASSGQH